MRMKRLLFLLMFLLLAACGSENDPVLTLTLPSDTPKATIELVQSSVPAMEKHLPGLFKYQGSLSFLGVNPNYPYAAAPGSGLSGNSSVTWLAFKVADDDTTVPKDYYARGHRIEIGIEEGGHALILRKRQAKSVFLDKPFPPSGEDLVIKI